MKNKSTLSIALAVVSAGAIVSSAHAQSGNTLSLSQTAFWEFYADNNDPRSAIKQGLMHIDRQEANAAGGSLVVTVDKSSGCPAGSRQQFAFSWSFQRGNLRDASQMVFNGIGVPALTVFFQVQLLAANGRCINEDPGMTLYASDDPFGQRPGGTFYFDPNRHLIYGPPGSGNAFSHTPGPFQIHSRYQEAGQLCTPAGLQAGTCTFQIVIGSFQNPGMGFEMHVKYIYHAGAAPRTTLSGAQLLINWAARYSLFGSPVGQFYTYSYWISGWTLSYLDFAYSGGRSVRVYLATSQSDANVHAVLYWDPDAGAWRGWSAL
jgi:hypothetical protein